MIAKLDKPCPRCNSRRTLIVDMPVHDRATGKATETRKWWVTCSSCRFESDPVETRAAAVKSWTRQEAAHA